MHGVAFFYPSVDEGKRLRRVCDWDDTNVVALEGFDKGARPGSKGRAHLSPKPHPEGLRAGQWPGSWVWRELFEGGGTSIVRYRPVRAMASALQAQLPGPGGVMAERGLSIAHTTIMRWVHHCAPEFERRWNHFAQPAEDSWRVDETYVKICGEW
jgi:hypothetical protein